MVAISAGAAKIQADWNVWNTIAAYPYPPSFCFGWTTCVDYAVVGADIDTDSNNDGYIDHATDDPVEDQYPGACLARYSGHAEELSEVDIRSIGVTDPEADLLTGKVTFTGDIRVWADRDRTEEITSGTQWDLYYTGELPTAVYVEGENAGQSSMTWTVFAGETQLASDTVKFSLLTASLIVTNMAPLDVLPVSDSTANTATATHLRTILGQVTLPAGFSVGTSAITASEFGRGGEFAPLPGNGGDWLYSPCDTTYLTFAPWDPYHTYGGGPCDGDWGGAAIFITVTDANGRAVKVKVNVGFNVGANQNNIGHLGYTFLHRDGLSENSGDEWVESTPHGGEGGLMLVGGGADGPGTPVDGQRFNGSSARAIMISCTAAISS